MYLSWMNHLKNRTNTLNIGISELLSVENSEDR